MEVKEQPLCYPIMLTASFAFRCNCKQRFTVQVNIYKETGAIFFLVNVEKKKEKKKPRPIEDILATVCNGALLAYSSVDRLPDSGV